MSILQIQPLNKRDQQVLLHTGIVIKLSVERMHEVGMYLNSEEVGRLKFKALSSLNSLDISPLYKLYEVSIHPELKDHSTDISLAAVSLFREYTKGRIKVSQDIENHIALQNSECITD